MSVACAVRARRLADDPDTHDDHINECLRCQAEAVRYRTLSRQLTALRAELVEAPAGLAAAVAIGSSPSIGTPKKAQALEAAVATAGLAAVAGAIALWRRTMSA